MTRRQLNAREIEDLLDGFNERFRAVETVVHHLWRTHPNREQIRQELDTLLFSNESNDLASLDPDATIDLRAMLRELARKNILRPQEPAPEETPPHAQMAEEKQTPGVHLPDGAPSGGNFADEIVGAAPEQLGGWIMVAMARQAMMETAINALWNTHPKRAEVQIFLQEVVKRCEEGYPALGAPKWVADKAAQWRRQALEAMCRPFPQNPPGAVH